MKAPRLLLWISAFFAGALAVFFLVRRGSPAGAPVVTLRFWNGFTGPDGRTMLKIIREFNRQNPDIHVLMQRMDWGTYYNKLFVAGLSGRGPEVFVVHASSLPRFARAHRLEPLGPLIQGQGGAPLPVADFDANVWRAMQIGGETMAIPLDIHPLGMYVNNRLLREAGFSRPPATREEFLAVLRRFKARRERGEGPPRWGFVFTTYRTNLVALMAQFGGRLVSEDGSRCLLDSPENVAALEFCAGLIREGLAPRPENFDAWIGFRQGKVALAFEGLFLLPDLEKQPELDYGGAPLPVLGRRPATWADSHGLCLRAGLKGRPREAAWRFIRFLSDHSLQWARAGQIPVRLSLRETAAFRGMRIQSAFARQIPYVHYPPRVPFIFEFFTEFDLAVERALRGSLPAREALAIATERINRAIERDRRENAPPTPP